MNISAKIGPNLFSGFREEYEKFTDMDDDDDDDDDAKWWQKLTWPFGPGELKHIHFLYGKFNTDFY
jgi:hypothetical protein